MDLEALRERLHQYIDIADEQHLSAIYVLVKDKIPSADEQECDQAILNIVYERRENHLKGKSKSYTVEEAMNYDKAA